MRILMATGDYHHTALAVARGVGMLSPQAQVIIIQAEKETKPSSVPDVPFTSENHVAPPQASSPLSIHHPGSAITSAVADGKERHREVLQWPLTDNLPGLPGVGPQTVSDACSEQVASNTTSALGCLSGHLSDSSPMCRMRDAGSTQHRLVFEVYNGSVGSDTAQQAVKAIAQVGVASMLL